MSTSTRPKIWNLTLVCTSHSSGSEERMEALQSFVQDRLGLTYNQLASRVERVEDHKGDLTVTWRIDPTGDERQAWELGWERQNELASNVTHVF